MTRDHDPVVRAVLDEIAPPARDLPGWEDVARRAKAHHRRTWPLSVRAIALGGVAVAAVVVAAVALVGPQGGGPSMVERAAAAVGGQSGQIEHIRASNGTIQTESWTLEGHGSFVITTFPDGSRQEHRAGAICSILALPPTAEGCVSTGAAIKRALTAGEVKVLPDGSLNGRAVKRLAFDVASLGLSGIYEVDPQTLRPVRLSVSTPEVLSPTGAVIAPARVVTEEYSLFEYLPATPENLALLAPKP